MSKRQSLKAYLTLQQCHKELHKTLRALEEDATDAEVVRRIEDVQQRLNEVITLVGVPEPRSLTALERAA